MTKFLRTYQNGEKNSILFRLESGQEIWASTTQAVVNFNRVKKVPEVKGKGEPGIDMDIVFAVNNGQHFVTKVNLNGEVTNNESVSQPPQQSQSTPESPVCEDCGIELKDDKYKKCYNCNQATPKTKKNTYSKSPEDKEQIKRLACLHAASRAVTTLAGQVDPKAVGDMVMVFYEKFLKKVSE